MADEKTDDFEDVVDPFALNRPEPITETRAFTDARQPKKRLTLTFRAEADHSLTLRVQRLATKYVADHMTGRLGRDKKTRTRVPLRPVGGRLVEPDEDLFWQIATFEALQVKTEKTPTFNVFGWVALSVQMPTAFGEIAGWASEMVAKAAGTVETGELEAGELPPG